MRVYPGVPEPGYSLRLCAELGREGEDAHILTLSELKDTEVDMFTTVYIGNSQTRNMDGKMVTPRGYRLEE